MKRYVVGKFQTTHGFNTTVPVEVVSIKARRLRKPRVVLRIAGDEFPLTEIVAGEGDVFSVKVEVKATALRTLASLKKE